MDERWQRIERIYHAAQEMMILQRTNFTKNNGDGTMHLPGGPAASAD
jgi:hypothetical protein